MENEVTKDELVSLKQQIDLPHVVILGAGASLAACPNGDALGKQLPLMNNLVQVLGLETALAGAGLDVTKGFEALYSQLYAADPNSDLIRQIECQVEEYFSQMFLPVPSTPTLYDRLLLSLRPKDAIFTFNWDPFLFDAFRRLHSMTHLPYIFHLHGNVRLAFCLTCRKAMRRAAACGLCGGDLTPTRLLYPVEQKNYTADPFISTQWDRARDFLGHAFLLTIFGYSAPVTDKEAVAILKSAWRGDGQEKIVNWVEIIDIRDPNELHSQWSSFAFSHHYSIYRSLSESLLARYPRRSCEAWYYSGFDGKLVEEIPWADSWEGMQKTIEELTAYESTA